MSFIYNYKTSTRTPFVKPHDILNLAVRNIFYIQSCVESAFMYNQGSTTYLASFGDADGTLVLFETII